MEKDSKHRAVGQTRSAPAQRFMAMRLEDLTARVDQPLDPAWVRKMLRERLEADDEFSSIIRRTSEPDVDHADQEARQVVRDLMVRLGVAQRLVGQ